ncbi:MAG: pyridoxal-phosphate dependent enzyme [Sandaracinaceae bacterium]
MTVYATDLAAIRGAHDRIQPHVHRTPVMTSGTLDRRAGRSLFFKCENFQRGGAFKMRGASNAVWRLDAETASRGIVTHSSGNHAQAVAIAARDRGVPAHIVMPTDAPRVKRAAVEGYGATVHPCAPTLDARTETAANVVAQTGGTLIPPYDHPDVIAGQGTIALELLAQVDALDAVVVPVGGGGMIAGITLALREAAPHVRVFAAEPAGADDAARGKAAGERVERHTPDTIADGLRTTLGELTWPVVRDCVEEVLVVPELAIVPAMKLVFERMKLVIEPSAAVGLAAVLSSRFRGLGGLERVGVVLCGGNVDLDALPWIRRR